MEVISENRQARHDYFLEDFFECGLVLKEQKLNLLEIIKLI